MKSMTGYASVQTNDPLLGRTSLDIRSINHRFLEIICNLSHGLSYLEEEIRKEISKKIKRGRVIVTFNFSGRPYDKVVINKAAIKNYHKNLERLRKEFALEDNITLDMLMRLPGVVMIEEEKSAVPQAQAKLKELLKSALSRLDASRAKAGKALCRDLRTRNFKQKQALAAIKKRAAVVIKRRAAKIENVDEKSSFLKSSDIAEELTLLEFHLNNFRSKLNKSIPIGKELDFISQETQREINTLSAKSFDPKVVERAIELKTQNEKIREQLQNVE